MDNRWLLVAPCLATAISLALGLWLGYLFQGRRVAATLATAPLLLPPAVICAYLFLPSFTLPVAVAGGVVFGLPFLLRSSRMAFQSVDARYLNSARSLGATEWRVFWRVALPLAWWPVLTATGIVFVRIAAELAVVFWIDRRLHL